MDPYLCLCLRLLSVSLDLKWLVLFDGSEAPVKVPNAADLFAHAVWIDGKVRNLLNSVLKLNIFPLGALRQVNRPVIPKHYFEETLEYDVVVVADKSFKRLQKDEIALTDPKSVKVQKARLSHNIGCLIA